MDGIELDLAIDKTQSVNFTWMWMEGKQQGQGQLIHANHLYEGEFQECALLGKAGINSKVDASCMDTML